MKKLLSLVIVAALVLAMVPATFASEDATLTQAQTVEKSYRDKTIKFIFNRSAYNATFTNYDPASLTIDQINTSVSDPYVAIGRRAINNARLEDTTTLNWNSHAVNIRSLGSAMALKVTINSAGTFVPELTYQAEESGPIMGIYLQKCSDAADVPSDNSKMLTELGKMKAENQVGIVDFYSETSVKKTVRFDAFTIDEAGDYYLYFATVSANDNWTPWNPSATDTREFLTAKIYSLYFIDVSNDEAMADGTLTYNFGMGATRKSLMYGVDKNGKGIDGATGTGLSYSSSTVYRSDAYGGSIYNLNLMNWSATSEIGSDGKACDPFYIMDLEKTDPWAYVYCDLYANVHMRATTDCMYFNNRAGTKSDPLLYGNVKAETSTTAAKPNSSLFDEFLLLKVVVPNTGKYNLSVNKISSAAVSGAVLATYFFPVEGSGITSASTARSRLINASASEKLGYVNFSSQEIDGCIDTVEVNVPKAGEYYIGFKFDATSVEKNPSVEANGDYMYYNTNLKSITLEPVATEELEVFSLSAVDNTIDKGANTSVSLTKKYSGETDPTSATGVTYFSSNENVATVDGNGAVTGVDGGVAYINALDIATGTVSNVRITVNDKDVKKSVTYATNIDGTLDIVSVEMGETVTVSAPKELNGKTFRHWVRGTAENGTWVSANTSYTFKAMTHAYLTAVYSDATEGKVVEFFNENREYLGSAVANAEGKVTLPENPSRTGRVFSKWLLDENTEFTKDTVVTAPLTRVVASYTDDPTTYTVNGVDGYTYGTAIEFSAPTSGETTWYRNGKAVAHSSKYTYYVWDDATITNKAAGAKKPIVILDSDKKGDAYMIEYDSVGKTIVEVGILFGPTTPTVERCGSKATSQLNLTHGQFTAKPGSAEDTAARGYIIYNDNGTYRVIYSD